MEIRKGKKIINSFPYFSQTIKFALFATLIFLSITTLHYFPLSHYLPIKTVRVYGLSHTDQTELQNILLPLVNRGFFGVDVEFIRDRLLQMPWVADTLVRRHWPDEIEVTVVEKKPIARWNESHLLSDAGDVFQPEQSFYDNALPRFVGPQGKQMLMLDSFKEMNRLLGPLHAKIAYLELTPYLTWKLILSNGITMQIGHTDILTRLDQFVKVYPKIIGDRAKDVEYVDLRYPNGVAVRWNAGKQSPKLNSINVEA